MMSTRITQKRARGWKFALCSVAIVATAAGGSAVADAAPVTAPGAPTITAVTAGVRSVKVAFTRPATNGGAHIDRYQATCTSTDGGVTRSDHHGRSAIKVDGLTAAKTYTCTVRAHNKKGFGPSSAPSGAVVTLSPPVITPPGAPTITSATPGVRSVKVAFTRPATNGGAHIDRYQATCTSSDGGVTRSAHRDHSAINVDGLTAAKTYTCTVRAHNKKGFGPASAPSAAVVTLSPPVITVPGAPTITNATPGKRSVKLAFTHPASNGGAHIDRYQATCTSSDGGVTRSAHRDHSAIKVDGLTGAKTYTCTVRAHNKKGFGPSSAPSAAVVTRKH